MFVFIISGSPHREVVGGRGRILRWFAGHLSLSVPMAKRKAVSSEGVGRFKPECLAPALCKGASCVAFHSCCGLRDLKIS